MLVIDGNWLVDLADDRRGGDVRITSPIGAKPAWSNTDSAFSGRVVLLYPGWQLPNVAYSLTEQEND